MSGAKFDSLKKNSQLSLMDFCVGLYVASIVLVDGTILFYIATAFLCFVGIINMLYRRQMPINSYVFLMLLFIGYNAFTIFSGVVQYQDVSVKRLSTVIINFVVNYVLFIYFTHFGNRLKAMKYFKLISWILILYITIFDFSSILQGRFGQDTRYIFGLTGTNGYGYNSNLICRIIYTSIIFSIFLRTYFNPDQVRNRKNIISICILMFVLLLTGSRSGLIIILLFVAIFFTLYSKNITAKLKYLIGGIILIVVAYILVMNIDFLYHIIGYRLEILLDGIMAGGEYESQTSAYYRGTMIDMGLGFFKERPIFGWGLDSFSKISIYGTYSHSNFVELLVSCGLIGFIIYYFAYLTLMWNSFGYRKNEFYRAEACMTFAFLLPLLIMNIAIVNYVDRISLFFFYLAAGAIFEWKQYPRK